MSSLVDRLGITAVSTGASFTGVTVNTKLDVTGAFTPSLAVMTMVAMPNALGSGGRESV